MSTERLKQKALARISTIVDKVFEDSEVYRKEIDRTAFMQYFSNRLENGLVPEEVISITEEELTRWIRQNMAINVLSGLLSDLTPEEMKIFEDAVKRR
jgi:hypothetical protein